MTAFPLVPVPARHSPCPAALQQLRPPKHLLWSPTLALSQCPLPVQPFSGGSELSSSLLALTCWPFSRCLRLEGQHLPARASGICDVWGSGGVLSRVLPGFLLYYHLDTRPLPGPTAWLFFGPWQAGQYLHLPAQSLLGGKPWAITGVRAEWSSRQPLLYFCQGPSSF